MLVPGELNNVKGNSRDRMDRFICLLNEYFKEREENKDNGGYDKYGHKLFSKAKGNNYKKEYRETCLEVIYEYLSLFEDVYDYCGQIYKMDAAAVKRFLASGEKEHLKRVEMWLNICNWRRIIGKTNIISFFTHSWEHVEK